MGSMTEAAQTRRAVALLDEAPPDYDGSPLPELRRHLGEQVTIEDVILNNEHAERITAQASIVTGDGETHRVELGTVAEITGEGVCGYSLEDSFPRDVLRRMIEAALADSNNDLDDHDREKLREHLAQLG